MSPVVIILVLFSALCHASWNFFIKGSRYPSVAYWWMMATGLTVCLPAFVYVYTTSAASVSVFMITIILASGLTKAFYYVTLGGTYRHCDLSLGYPIARSGTLLIPIWAYLFLDEKIALSAGVGIAIILAGVYLLNVKSPHLASLLPSRAQLSKGIYLALMTAVLMSIYSVIDKAGVQVPGFGPFNFLYVMFFASFLFLTPYVLWKAGVPAIREEARGRLGMLTLMGLLDLTGYLAILFAMTKTQVSYVMALRQVAVVLGAIMGTAFLKEKYGSTRILASVVIFAGSWLVSISK